VLALLLGVIAALVLPNGLSWRSDSPYRDTVMDLTNYREGSGRGRLIQYRNSARLVRMDPVFGTGPGNWPVKYPLVTTRGDPSYAASDPMPTNPWPSSDWVAMLSERGLVAVLLLLAAFAAMGVTAMRRLRHPDPALSRRAIALLGVLAATIVTGAFDAVLLLAPPTPRPGSPARSRCRGGKRWDSRSPGSPSGRCTTGAGRSGADPTGRKWSGERSTANGNCR
jgi:O-antigen ligase